MRVGCYNGCSVPSVVLCLQHSNRWLIHLIQKICKSFKRTSSEEVTANYHTILLQSNYVSQSFIMPSVSVRELCWHGIRARHYLERFCYSWCCTLKIFAAVCLDKKYLLKELMMLPSQRSQSGSPDGFAPGCKCLCWLPSAEAFALQLPLMPRKSCQAKAAEKTAVRKLRVMVGMTTEKIPGWDLLFTHTTLRKVKPCGFFVRCLSLRTFGVTQDTGCLGFISGRNTCDLTWHFFVSLLYLNYAELSPDWQLNVGKSFQKTKKNLLWY